MQPYEKIPRRTPSEVAVSALAPERAPSTDFSLSATPFHFFSLLYCTHRGTLIQHTVVTAHTVCTPTVGVSSVSQHSILSRYLSLSLSLPPRECVHVHVDIYVYTIIIRLMVLELRRLPQILSPCSFLLWILTHKRFHSNLAIAPTCDTVSTYHITDKARDPQRGLSRATYLLKVSRRAPVACRPQCRGRGRRRSKRSADQRGRSASRDGKRDGGR